MTPYPGSLPTIPGYAWQPLQAGDVAALQRLEQDCAPLDGVTIFRSAAEWAAVVAEAAFSQTAVSPAGEIAAVGWLTLEDRVDSVHAFHFGRVQPQFRGQGIGRALLGWLEAAAVPRLQEMADGRPSFLRTYFYDREPQTIGLLLRSGYERQYAEDELRLDLRQTGPTAVLRAETAVFPWTPANAGDFYAVYRAAFASRTASLLDAAAWANHFANPDDDEFRPHLSRIVQQDGAPVAYAVVYVEGTEPETAWISQMGVHQTYRRQGLGRALLLEMVSGLAAAGYRQAALSVNVDNPQARALYEQVGFRLRRRLSVYRKAVVGG